MGMPKTGTTALQHALHDGAERLEGAGLYYPIGLRDEEGIAHHALAQELDDRNGIDGPQATEFLAMLNKCGAERILISSEAFLNLLSRGRILTLLLFLRRCMERRPTRVVIACRRIDSFLESMYLHSVKVGETTADPADYLEQRRRWPLDLLAQVSVLRNIGLLDRLILIKYERADRFVQAILNALSLRPHEQALLRSIGSSNARLGAKAQAYLLHLPEFTQQFSQSVSRPRLIRAFERGTFSFKNEIINYSVLDIWKRAFLHETALRASLEFGIPEYVKFYHNEKVEEMAVVKLRREMLDANDLSDVSEFVASCAE